MRFPNGQPKLNSVWCHSPTVAWAVGQGSGTRSTIVYYDGNPDNWASVMPFPTAEELLGVWGVGTEAWAVGANGTILRGTP